MCHHRLRIDFSDITTLVGINEAGKTSALLAFCWVAFNDPPGGKEIIRWGAKRAKVILHYDNHIITRIRDKRRNIYKLDGKLLKAFHPNVPDEVKRIINLDETNIHRQQSPLFLLSDTAGQVSKTLNAIINLEEMDELLARAGQETKRARNEVIFIQERLDKEKQEKDRLRWIVPLAEAFADLESLSVQCDREGEEIHSFSETLGALELHDYEIKELDGFLIQSQRLLDQAVSYASYVAQTSHLEELISLYEENQRWATLQIPSFDWNGFLKTQEEIQSLEERISLYYSGQEEIQAVEKTIRSLVQELDTLTNGRCPVCLRKWIHQKS